MEMRKQKREEEKEAKRVKASDVQVRERKSEREMVFNEKSD